MPHSFGPNELWALIDNARMTIALIIALSLTIGAVAGLIIASLEARRDNKTKTRREPTSTSTLENDIEQLLSKQYGARINQNHAFRP
jgi:cell division protein FtsX